jgi:Uma2 family endonuclease
MDAATSNQLLTAADLDELPADYRCELVKGELIDMPPPGYHHGRVIFELGYLLAAFIKPRKLGRLLGAETGFRLSRNPDTVRGIDIAFVSTSRQPAGELQGYFEGAPDLAVEVLSPNDRAIDVEAKIADLLLAGARLVWVVNPQRKTVTVHTPGAQPLVLKSTDTIDGGDVLPGFSCVVAQLLE